MQVDRRSFSASVQRTFARRLSLGAGRIATGFLGAVWRRACRGLALSVATAALAVPAIAAGAADMPPYPSRPVRLIVPWPAGGSSDNVARLIAQHLAVDLGINLYIENRGGAGGLIGMRDAARSAPDGYTLVAINNSTNVALDIVTTDLGYDPVKSFSMISTTALVPAVLVVSPSVKANNLRELIALAKRRPGDLTFASYGIGSSPHLQGELFASAAGVRLRHIPYKGGAAAKLDLLAGRVDMLFTDLTVLEDVKAGRLKAMMTTAPQRVATLPDVPTAAEAGLKGFDHSGWHAIAAPAGAPHRIIDYYNRAIQRVLTRPDVIETLATYGMVPSGSSPVGLEQRIQGDLARYRDLASSVKLKTNE